MLSINQLLLVTVNYYLLILSPTILTKLCLPKSPPPIPTSTSIHLFNSHSFPPKPHFSLPNPFITPISCSKPFKAYSKTSFHHTKSPPKLFLPNAPNPSKSPSSTPISIHFAKHNPISTSNPLKSSLIHRFIHRFIHVFAAKNAQTLVHTGLYK